MKALRFLLLDLWVKIGLWVLLGPIMLIYKVIQYAVSFGTRGQRQDTAAIRKALEKHARHPGGRGGERDRPPAGGG